MPNGKKLSDLEVVLASISTMLQRHEKGLADRIEQAIERRVESHLRRISRIAWVNAVGQNLAPTTEFRPRFTGDTIGTTDLFVSLYKNNKPWPVSCRVQATFATPGVKVDLSLTGTVEGRVDQLANAADGKSESVQILLLPEQTLWINTAETGIALTSSDIFRTRVTDIWTHLGPTAWLGGGA